MRLFLLFLFSVVAAILISSLIATPLYQLFGVDRLTDFDNFGKRLAMLAILLTIVAILKYKGLLHYKNVGWSVAYRTHSGSQLLGYGFIVGILMMLPVTLLFHFSELRVLDISGFAWSSFIAKLASLLLAAFAVSLIEETFFRGVLFDGFLREKRPTTALFLCALFFSVIHFARIKGAELPTDAPWYHGLIILTDSIADHWHSDYLATAVSLFLAGVLLGIVRLKTASVWACIGIHSGWILTLKVDKKLSDFNAQSDWNFLVGPYDSYNGWATSAWLAIILVVYATVTAMRKKASG
ncbi:MAG: CPBP family intramembrane metalloprotease [Chromatiales bacterium]|nr:CPBP family intramembrane metalloprotease [Chromatiales bacterium]